MAKQLQSVKLAGVITPAGTYPIPSYPILSYHTPGAMAAVEGGGLNHPKASAPKTAGEPPCLRVFCRCLSGCVSGCDGLKRSCTPGSIYYYSVIVILRFVDGIKLSGHDSCSSKSISKKIKEALIIFGFSPRYCSVVD